MMFTKDVYLILMNHCTHLEILKRIFKVVFLFSYQSSVLKEPCIYQCFFKFLSLPYRGDLIIISPHPTYVNNFFQLFSILKIASFFYNFFTIFKHTISICIIKLETRIFTGIIAYMITFCITKRLAYVSLLKIYSIITFIKSAVLIPQDITHLTI